MSDERKPVLRIYTEQTSDLGGIWAFKPYAMRHVVFVEDGDFKAERNRADEFAAALVDHNDLLRSAMQICQRAIMHEEFRALANWDAFHDNVAKALKKHHAVTNTARATVDKG